LTDLDYLVDLVSHPFCLLILFVRHSFSGSRVKRLILYSSINDSKTEDLQLGTIDYDQLYSNSTIKNRTEARNWLRKTQEQRYSFTFMKPFIVINLFLITNQTH